MSEIVKAPHKKWNVFRVDDSKARVLSHTCRNAHSEPSWRKLPITSTFQRKQCWKCPLLRLECNLLCPCFPRFTSNYPLQLLGIEASTFIPLFICIYYELFVWFFFHTKRTRQNVSLNVTYLFKTNFRSISWSKPLKVEQYLSVCIGAVFAISIFNFMQYLVP